MKKLTKLLSLFLAAALAVMSFSLNVAADDVTYSDGSGSSDAYTVTINGSSSSANDYTFYQIFTGTVSADDKGTLSNIQWGTAVTDTSSFISALNTAFGTSGSTATLFSDLDTSADAATVAEALAKITTTAYTQTLIDILTTYVTTEYDISTTDSTASPYATVSNGTYKATGVAAGYYLILNSSSDSSLSNKTTTGIVLAVIGNTTASNKITDDATVDKTVKYTDDNTDNTYSDSTYSYTYGDSVPFTITVTLPDTIYAYDNYYLKISDTLINLTYNSNSVKVVITNGSNTYTLYEGDGTTYSYGSFDTSSGLVYYYTFTDSELATITSSALTSLADLADYQVVMTYEAEVTDTAVNFDYDGTYNSVNITYSDDPANDGSGGSTETTKDDPTPVYQYAVKVNKTDGSNELGGAFFNLYPDNGSGSKGTPLSTYKATSSTPAYETVTAAADNLYTFYFLGLDAGTYYLSETTTPSGYNTVGDYTIAVNSDGSVTVTDFDGNTTSYTVSDLSSAGGVIELTVTNKSGSSLPSTGGMGTKIFYTLGGILVAGAGVLLIVKRRMRSA